jgi:mono/diheme cytochrome c family protein
MSFPFPYRFPFYQTALLSLIVVGGGRGVAAEGDPALQKFEADIQPVLDQYCYDCHGNGSSKGGVQLDGFETAAALKDHKLWMRALNNVRTHLMPPAGKTPLPPEAAAKLAAWIKRDAFDLDPAKPDPGRVTVRRLNRVEYRNTILALTGIDYDTQTEFPADDTGHGFDNIGDVLTISPMLMEKYLDAAQAVISKAVPSEPRVIPEESIEGRSFLATSLPPEAVEINPEEEVVSKPAVTGAETPKPLRRPKPIAEGTSLDLSYYTPATVAKTFEATHPGKYELVFNLKAVEHYVDDQFDYNRCKLIIKSDGETLREQEFVREGDQAISYTMARDWPAGPHQITVEIQPLGPEKPQVRMLRLRLKDVMVRGPFEKKYWVRPKNYARFFPMDPPKSASKRSRYAKEIISRFATRAYRRPVDDQTVSRLADIAVKVGSEPGGTFEAGVAQAMVAVLASPRFIFREEESEPLQAGQTYPLVDEYALASRMSYFLWSSMPDDELFRLAGAHQLRANLSAQIDRMLKDRRSLEFIRNFSGQWLQARDIASVPINSFEIYLREHPDPAFDRAKITFQSVVPIPENKRTPEQVAAFAAARKVFFGLRRRSVPDLSDKVRDAMLKETQLYFGYVIQEDRSLTELIDSHYTFLNETLAKHYGVEGVVGKEMRRVELPTDSPRGGILTQGTVLAVTSNPTRTSPVKRGVFILEAILGTPPAPPPPNIPALEDAVSRSQLKKMSLRETMAVHASNKLCASCHSRMDPLGLALENFNAMGRWREAELDQPINPAGKLVTGESFTDIRELKRILATNHREDFYYAFSEKLLTYGLGRGVEYYDTDTLDQLVAKLDASGGRPSVLIRGIIESVPFQQRRIEPPVNLKAAAVAAGESSNRVSQNAP